jgi:hypothetical protein
VGVLCALLTVGACVPDSVLGADAPARSPLAGTALWIREVPALESAQQLAARALRAGVHTLLVKAADGSTPEAQFSPALVSELRAAGVSVCAWTFVYGQSPLAEAAVDAAAVADGAQCLVVDAEGQYDKLYGAAQLFVRTLRADVGARLPIGLAGQAEVAEHPTFPYSVFLGPGAFNFDLPQMYWLELGVSVDGAYAATIAGNALYGRPILPVGQIFGAASASELLRFRALAGAYGAAGVSFFDLDAAQPAQLAALAATTPRIARRPAVYATLRPGADGDQVLWAQELLNAAGARLPVGGFFGSETARAVAAFQARHRLLATGVIGAGTWRALLRLHPREPSWAGGPPLSAR